MGDRMKFVTYKKNDSEKVGVLFNNDEQILDVNSLLKKEYASMISFINGVSLDEIKKIDEVLKSNPLDGLVVDTTQVKLLSPIPRPIHDIICVGVNYKDHMEETKKYDEKFVEPTKTVYFSKRASYIIGDGDLIESRLDLDEELDYEVELTVIIGKTGVNIKKEEVEDYIFGYSIFNDISSRKLQMSHLQWYRGKSLDTYSSMGPSILHKSALPFPVEVDIKSELNGEVRQKSNTKLFVADIAQIISEISDGITLEAGDIIITGTPSGVGMGMNPKGYMKKGDIIRCEILEIGKLTNIVK